LQCVAVCLQGRNRMHRQSFAVCYSVLQCDAVCCSVLQCVAVCSSVLQCIAVCCRVDIFPPSPKTQSVPKPCVLQCVAVCCSVLQWVAVCCSALHCDVWESSEWALFWRTHFQRPLFWKQALHKFKGLSAKERLFLALFQMSPMYVGYMGRRANRCRAHFQKHFSKREAFLGSFSNEPYVFRANWA